MSEFYRTTPAMSSADQQAPVVFMDIQDGRLVKMIMTREEAEARRFAAASQDNNIDDEPAVSRAPAAMPASLPTGDVYPPIQASKDAYDGQVQATKDETERRGVSVKKAMAKFAIAAMVVAPYPIGDTIGTFLQSGNVPSVATMVENVTQLPGQSVEFYQGALATIQGAKSLTDTINSIKGNK